VGKAQLILPHSLRHMICQTTAKCRMTVRHHPARSLGPGQAQRQGIVLLEVVQVVVVLLRAGALGGRGRFGLCLVLNVVSHDSVNTASPKISTCNKIIASIDSASYLLRNSSSGSNSSRVRGCIHAINQDINELIYHLHESYSDMKSALPHE
jgi:hypothetical protein